MNNQKKKEKLEEHTFSTDRPILFIDEDKLNRNKFSQELATSICKWNEKDSLVLAVYGNWGEGKSSVKNMVKDSFSKQEKSLSPVSLEFNPWQWSGEQHITDAFFKELSRKLSSTGDRKQKVIAKKFEDYAEYLDISNEIVDKIKSISEKILILISGGSIAMTTIVPPEFKQWLIAITMFCLVLSFGLKEVLWGIKIIGRFLRISSGVEKNLEERKNELKKLLQNMEKTLVVFLDDIDRLSRNEIKSLFRVIKANADFPNIVYLTFFQRDIVENSLNEEGVYKGSDYLKKIVQVGFDLPKVPVTDIHKVLFEELDKLLGKSSLNDKFEKGRWSELFNEGVGNYFNNLRDVKRFVSTFSFHLGLLKKNKSYEVNFVDLIGLEVLRQFESNVYQKIFFEKKLLTSSSSSSISTNSQKIEEERIMSSILESSSEGAQERVKSIIKVLFPNAQWAWGSNYLAQVNPEDFVNHRVNHEDNFNKYFSLFLPEEDFSQSDFEHAVSISGDEEQLTSFLMNIYNQNRLPLFVKKFEAYKQVVDKKNAIPFIKTMLKLGDLLTDEHEGFFSISPITNVRRIIHWYFKKQDFGEDKKEIYKNALEKSEAIYLPIDLLWDEYERRNEDKYADLFVFDKDDKDVVKKIIIKKIKQSSETNDFKQNIHLPKILYIWKQLEPKESQEWIDSYLEDDKNLISFLVLLESKGFTSSGYETSTNYSIPLEWLKNFVTDVEALFKRVRALESKFSNSNNRIKRVFTNIAITEDEYLHPENYKRRY